MSQSTAAAFLFFVLALLTVGPVLAIVLASVTS